MSDLPAFDIHRGTRPDTSVGRLSVGPAGQMTLAQADEDYDSSLRNIIALVNGLETLRIKVPVPDSEPGGITFQDVRRDDPDLTTALQQYLEQKYDLHLTPAEA